ncbi:TonB-dependent receptor [Caulobacter sp. BP25]|uniref:TonB-dependent receptor n=1 Tax=Caulobacter sp. BP25 TaxID=2048900 RepID=UPI001F0070E0|nr:TonB-dependent receptor [Caulobacter sp. BP25]
MSQGKMNRVCVVALATASSIALMTGMASAQTAGSAQTESDAVEEVVVTGFKQMYANAAQMKRDAIQISDSISSDGLGRFPDLNVGEAMQRIPGVQINREADSRDATINLRGLPGTFARVTLNGGTFADPILDGSTPLGAFNSDIFSAITVIKSPTAADQAGGLSGNIDLRIQGALDRPEGGAAKVAVEYNELGKSWAPRGTLSYAKRFLDDRVGVFGVVAYSKEKFRRDSIFFNQYTALSPTTTPNYATRYASANPAGVLFPSDIRQGARNNEGHMVTAAGGVAYKPNDHVTFDLTGFLTRRELDGNTLDILDIDMRNSLTVIDPTGPVFSLDDGRAYVNRYSYSNASVFASMRKEPLLQQAWGVNPRLEWKNDQWKASAVGTLSKAKNHVLQTQFDVRRLPKVGGNGTSGTFFSGAGDIGDYLFTLSPDPAVVVGAGPYTYSGSGPTLVGSQGDQLIVAGSEGEARTEVKAIQGDAERFLDMGWLSSIKFGARYESNAFASDQYRTSAAGVQLQNVSSTFVTQSAYAQDFFGGAAGSYLSNWQTVNFEAMYNALRPVTVGPGQTLTRTGWINDTTNGGVIQQNFTNTDDISSAYAVANLKGDVAGRTVRASAGLRYEDTKNTIEALEFNAAKQRVTNEYVSKYHKLLPSFILAADLSDDLVLRAAGYKTYVRPQRRQVVPSTSISNTTNGYNVSFGSRDLKPYEATSYDTSLEWYNRPGGMIAIAAFQKKVRGLIGAATDKATLCPADATDLGLGRLTLNGDTCVSDILINGQPAVITASMSVNQNNPIKVSGVEFNIQQNLDFLPGFWRNFGGAFNYSYTTVSGTNANGTKAVLPGVSKNAVNVIGYYETSKFGVRAVFNYRDVYDLAAGGTFSGAARRVKARGQLDLSASYNINEKTTVSLDAFNLTDAMRTEFEGQELKPRRVDYDGRTFQFAIRTSF